ncbi:MAG TPA: hypothetical protein VHA52_10515, partial [Candidatus Babeliaceae bacterium]|nr:hypothetical protein [Candidatus Babeliaceae bacterium]
ISNPVQRKEHLEHRLQGIQNKTENDKKWFYVQWNGNLRLYDRPNTTYAYVMEFLSRLYYLIYGGKHAALVKTFSDITQEVNLYLGEETDEARLSQFLNTYTAALNQLLDVATKMSRYKFNRDNYPLIQRLVASHETGPFVGNVKLDIRNCFTQKGVKIEIQNPTKEQLTAWQEKANATIVFNRDSFACLTGYYRDLNNVMKASINETLSFNISDSSAGYKIVIQQDGTVTYEPLVGQASESDLPLQIENRSPLKAKVDLWGYIGVVSGGICETLHMDSQEIKNISWKRDSVILNPQSSPQPHKTFPITRIECAVSLTQTAPLRLGLKAGVYTCTLQNNGELQIQPHAKEVEQVEVSNRRMGKTDHLEVRYPKTQSKILSSSSQQQEVTIHNNSDQPIEVDIKVQKPGSIFPFIEVEQQIIDAQSSRTFTREQLNQITTTPPNFSRGLEFCSQVDFSITIREWKELQLPLKWDLTR